MAQSRAIIMRLLAVVHKSRPSLIVIRGCLRRNSFVSKSEEVVMDLTKNVTPRLSSSLILVDDQNRVLMVERNPNSKSFAGAYVRSTYDVLYTYLDA